MTRDPNPINTNITRSMAVPRPTIWLWGRPSMPCWSVGFEAQVHSKTAVRTAGLGFSLTGIQSTQQAESQCRNKSLVTLWFQLVDP